jgi:hypothetical protein
MSRAGLLDDELSKHSRLPLADDHTYALAFAEHFGLRPQPSRLLTALYRACGISLTVQQIGHTHQMTPGAVRRYICDLRKALESDAIDCQLLSGYWLTEEGMAECRAALWQMGEILRRAS